jgi:serine/threonine protein kinase
MKLLFENWRQYLEENSHSPQKDKNIALFENWGGFLDAISSSVRKFLNEKGYHINKKLGSGAFGTVYQIENKKTGRRMAVKVVDLNDRNSRGEYINYKFAMDNKASMPEEYSKYLPDVYEVIKGENEYFIFMELLEPAPGRVMRDLFSLYDRNDEKQKAKEAPQLKLFNDPEIIYNILKLTFRQFLQRFGLIMSKKGYSRVIPTAALKDFLETPVEKDRIKQGVGDFTPISAAELKEKTRLLSKSLALAIMEFTDEEPTIHDSRGRHKQVDEQWIKSEVYWILNDLFKRDVVPLGFTRARKARPRFAGLPKDIRKAYPEIENFIKAMEYLNDEENWAPDDLHSGNVMIRPKTKNLVVTDLGLFKFV